MGSRLVRFEVRVFPGARVIGRIVIQKLDVGIDDRTIQDLWERMAGDGSLEALAGLTGRTASTCDTVGWMGDFEPGADHYTYLAGVLAEAATPPPAGYDYRDVAACQMAVGWIESTQDADGGDAFVNASGHLSRAMQEHGYEFDDSHGLFEMECYTHARFRGPYQRGEPTILDFYSPCRKATGVA